MGIEVHPSAVVHPAAELADGVSIGPFCVVGPEVRIGAATRLISHVSVEGRTTIGRECVIHQFAVLGAPPQDLKFKGEPTALSIGDRNVIREYVSIHRASVGGKGVTVIGNDNFIMGYCHIAHDCNIGNSIIMTNYSALAGHAVLEDHVVMGGMAGVRQHARVGAYTMVGGMSRVALDVPPYVIVSGTEKAKLYGLNLVGLRRKGFKESSIEDIKRAFNILFRENLSRGEALGKIREELPDSDEIRRLVEFVKNSKGIISRQAVESEVDL